MAAPSPPTQVAHLSSRSMAKFLDIPVSQFMGAVFELILYGVYVIIFAGTVWVLRMRRRGKNARSVSPVIDICSWFVFITLTIHCAGTIWFTYYGYLVLGSNPLNQLIWLADKGTDAALLREAMYGLSALGTEIMLIYRLWIVWSRSWAVIAVPCALIVFDFVGFVIALHGSDHYASPALASATDNWLEPILFLFEAFTNILCSALIAFRIIRNSLQLSTISHNLSFSRRVQPVLLIIAESAAVYATLTTVVSVGLYLHDPMIFALVLVIPPIAGITSCLLLVRVGLDMATDTVSTGGISGGRSESLGFRLTNGRHQSIALSGSTAGHTLESEGRKGDDDLEAGFADAHEMALLRPTARDGDVC